MVACRLTLRTFDMPHWSRICVVLRSCFRFQKVAGFEALNFDLLVAGFE
jgi:hypothetical protein